MTGKFLFNDKMVQTEAAEVDVTAGLEVSASGKASLNAPMNAPWRFSLLPSHHVTGKTSRRGEARGEEKRVREPQGLSLWARRHLAELVAEVQNEENDIPYHAALLRYSCIHSFTQLIVIILYTIIKEVVTHYCAIMCWALNNNKT